MRVINIKDHEYEVPDVGDVVFNKVGSEGICTEILDLWHGTMYTISDSNGQSMMAPESVFKDNVLFVKH